MPREFLIKIWILRTYGVYILGLFFCIFALYTNAKAQDNQKAETKIFSISAYYSPLPHQKEYKTGTYEGDVELNGSGVNSASGKPVFPGLIAAPKGYEFGTKICIPVLGCGEVQDRGSAIVAGDLTPDRLDIWMGYGDVGLRRAMEFGKRHLECQVYEPGADVTQNFKFPSPKSAYPEANLPLRYRLTEELEKGHYDQQVRALQLVLQELGFFEGEIKPNYEEGTQAAVLAFQMEHKIIETKDDLGAGRFGPETREKLLDVYQTHREKVLAAEKLEQIKKRIEKEYGTENERFLTKEDLVIERSFLSADALRAKNPRK